ncbi:MAG: hypothetical protein Q7S45_01515 [Candidatus Curtissbacteria bacterium]|nr:hypothetical protein [Candidatus Curtissbacteria bacterium]
MTERSALVDQKQQARQEYYQEILQALGKPPQDGTAYPIPDCTPFFAATSTIHSPFFLLVDHKEIGLFPSGFHKYNAPGGLGDGKVIVQAKRPLGDSWVKEPLVVVEGLIANLSRSIIRGVTHSFSLREDGFQSSHIRYSVWDGLGNLIVISHPSPWYSHGKAPDQIWERVAEAIKSNPLLPDERLTMTHPPTTRPIAIKNVGASRD